MVKPDEGALRKSSREALRFSTVNRIGSLTYDAEMQRHHLLPREILTRPSFASLFCSLGRKAIGFDDFRRNGLLLPSTEKAAMRTAMPLHRGPHREYSALVIERIGQVEGRWSKDRLRTPAAASNAAMMRIGLLQGALRRRLLKHAARPMKLNRKDPLGKGFDFTELDAMARELWSATATGPQR